MDPERKKIIYLVACAVLLIALIAGYVYHTNAQDISLAENRKLATEISKLEKENQTTRDLLKETTEQLQATIRQLEENLEETTEELEEKENIIEQSKEQVDNVVETIGRLDKLSRLDPELLLKYSKVVFLNEHYVPEELVPIKNKYLLQPERNMQFHTRVYPELEEMINDARDDDINLKIVSAYRSFGTQRELKQNYVFTYGQSTANQFSAEQGYSEHQLGTTVDFTTPELGANFAGFEDTTAYQWLLDNAHKYGFILSYPADNPYYQFEPWHWRFVGTDLADYLDETNQEFYRLPQRQINEYLIDIFD